MKTLSIIYVVVTIYEYFSDIINSLKRSVLVKRRKTTKNNNTLVQQVTIDLFSKQ